VTSVRRYEGKSVVAVNLSEMIALSGSKTLLVDCNLRDAGLTRQLAPNATAGLVDVIAGCAAVQDLVWSDPISAIEFLPAAADSASRSPKRHEKPSASVLWQRSQLTAPGLQNVLQSVERRYDYVILDLPPLAVADVKAASHLIDSFVLVIGWGRTPQQAVIDALSASDVVFEKLLGAVLNKASLSELRTLVS
jgi:succinoglycan biosynthesis transport protein ExoP